jgi:hypothetical protein
MKTGHSRAGLSRRIGRLFACLVLVSANAFAAEIWVAPDGTDANPGTRDKPLATPARALRQSREMRRLQDPVAADGVRIILREGEYALSEPLLVRPEDGGTPNAPTVIAAAPGERPVLTGGVPLQDWRKLAVAETPANLPAAARGHVWVANVPRFNGRALEFRQLWVDGDKAIRARTPNSGDMIELAGWQRARRQALIPAAAPVPDRLEGVEMVLIQMWEIAVLRLKSHRVEGEQAVVTFHDPESRIEFEHPWPQPAFGPRFRNAAFFLANALEYLDSPGEWFADFSAGRVYLWPAREADLVTARVVAPALETLVEIDGTPERPVEHLRIEGIGFAHTTWLRPSISGHVPLQAGFYMRDAYGLQPKGTPEWRSLDNQAWLGRPPAAVTGENLRNVNFTRCRFEHTAASALDLRTGVQDSQVEGCDFSDIGVNGLVAGDFAEGGFESHLAFNPGDERVITGRLRLANNYFTDCANEDWGGVPIIAGFVRDTVIEHNEIAGTSYTGISLGWGWTRTANVMRRNTVRANRITRIALHLSDTAGIYTLSAQPGTVVAENYVDDVVVGKWAHDPEHWFYLYADEGTSFTTWKDNWVPAERFLQNANGPGNAWSNNGPQVDPAIKDAAGLQPEFRDLRRK